VSILYFKILVAFAKFRKATFSFFISLCPSVHPRETCSCQWNNCNKIDIWVFFENLSRKLKFH